MAEVNRVGDRIEIGETVRIEAGPPLRRRKAAADALDDKATAPHYQVGRPDAKGETIEEGKMFSYLDFYGPPVFYVFKRRELTKDDTAYKGAPDGTTPPLNADTTNIAGYTYVFDQVDVKATEDEAIELGQSLAAGE
ncbi:MAG: hypothetical protein ACJ8DZ_14130 [Allosphingosinicella sp.]